MIGLYVIIQMILLSICYPHSSCDKSVTIFIMTNEKIPYHYIQLYINAAYYYYYIHKGKCRAGVRLSGRDVVDSDIICESTTL